MRLVLCLLALSHVAQALVAGSALTKALGKARPVIVHVFDRNPADLASFALDDVSEAIRGAGATALLAAPELVPPLCAEQALHRGSFPGPVPVIADCYLSDLTADGSAENIAAWKKAGASAVGVRYYVADFPEAEALEETMRNVVTAAEASGLATILLGEFGADGGEGAEGADQLAAQVGAAAALTKSAADESAGAVAVGCWDGSDEGLQRLRERGFKCIILKDSCLGDVANGSNLSKPSLSAQMVTRLVKAAMSKASSKWGGSMFGVSGGVGSGDKGESMGDYFNQRGPG